MEDKILVGSSIKAINKSKIYGKLDLKKLALIRVIRRLKNNAGFQLDLGIETELNKLVRNISYKEENICNFRSDNAFTEISSNVFLTNTVNTNELYSLWISQGNTGTLADFLELILKDEDLKAELTNW